MELRIYWKPGTPDGSLAGFPFNEGQFIDREGPGGEAIGAETVTYIDLGDRRDTTVLQEQFLNLNPWCVEYDLHG